MKTLFAALASALLVSTAFAQTAAPSSAQPAQTQPAGQANLKASTAVQTSTDSGTATTKAPTKATTKAHVKKTSARHTVKPHQASKKKSTVDAGAEKTNTGSAKEASNAPVKTDGAKTDTTKTQ